VLNSYLILLRKKNNIIVPMDKIDLFDHQSITDIDGNTAIINLAITQGKTYTISVHYPNDVTEAIPLGQIRTRYAQDDNILLASFDFLPSTYDPAPINKTTITAVLSATVTAEIPYTKYQAQLTPDIIPTVKTCHVFDMELHFPDGVVDPLLPAAFVQVKPEVTIDD
jgi:hypothetical protein